MLEKLLLPNTHAISILIKDHDRVKALFEHFEKTKVTGEKENIIREAVTELKIHAVIEEELIAFAFAAEMPATDRMAALARFQCARTCFPRRSN